MKSLQKAVRSSISFRTTRPSSERFNSKDDIYSKSTPLAGFRHVHVWNGKCIITYKTVGEQALYLFSMTDHSAAESSERFVKYLNKFKASDFHPFNIEVEKSSLTADEIGILKHQIYEIAASDASVLKAAIRGDAEFMLEFLADSISKQPSEETTEMIIDAFGGKIGFLGLLKTTLANLGIRESLMRRFMNIVR